MVTRRAKRWLTRGAAITLLVILLALATATCVQGSSIAADWLTVESRTDAGSAVLAEMDSETVLLTDGDDLDRPGIWGLEGRDGHVTVGRVLGTTDDGVRRELLRVAGPIRIGAGVRFDRAAYSADVPPVELEEVLIEGPLGEAVAWEMDGSEDTWVVLVHGNGADRSQALRLLPALEAAGYPALVPTYRNDFGAPRSKGHHHGYGRDEWRDIAAAVDHALSSGARDFVMVGFGSGGSIVGTFLYEARSAERVVAAVLDSPVLSLGIAVDEAWSDDQIPGFIVGWAKAFATMRYGIDWSELDHVRRAHEWDVPVLILHGREDDEHPLRASAEFAMARIDSTRLLTFPEAGPGESWNTDPERYEAALLGFLERYAEGESVFERVDPD